MNGKVVIGCDLDTKELERDINKAKKQLEKFEKEEERLLSQKQKLELDTSKSYNNLQSIDDKLNIINQKIKNTENIKLPSELTTDIDYQKLINQRDQLSRKGEEYLQKLELEKGKLTDINTKLSNNHKEQTRLNGKINEMNSKLNSPKISLDKINFGLKNTVKSVAKWGLALFGIRSAYNAIRGAMSLLSQYDDQLASNVEYIQYALASTLKPVIETILNLVIRLLQYINYIAKAWTGKDLFASAKSFESMKKSASSTAKSTKEINKQLASFDEMNILSDTSTSGGAGGADIAAPNIDLTGIQGEVPSWVQWIADNKDLIIAALLGIAGGIIAIKLGADLLMGLGIGLIIAGIVKTVKAIIDFIKDPSWDNFAKILEGLAVILTGVAIAMLAVNAANPVAWIVLAIAAVVALAAVVIKNWDKIKSVLGVVGSWINDHIIKPIADFFTGLWNGIVSGVTWAVNGIKSIFNTVVSFFSGIINSILGFFKKLGTTVGNVVSSAFKGVVNGVLGAIESILNSPIRAVNRLIGVINKVPGINLGTLSTFRLPRLAKGGIINQPGRGIPVGYGQAVGGERGQEGVLPLTDSQQMELLGQSIGKYVNINLTNITKLDNRQIAKEQRKINAQSDFAFNR